MGASVSLCNFYENHFKKRESIVVISPHADIQQPPGIRKSKRINWKDLNMKSN